MRCYLLDHPELHAKFREGDRQVLRDVWDFHEPQLREFFESGFITAKPKEPGGEVHQDESGHVSPRPVIEVTCRGGTLSACPRGAEIAFGVKGKGVQGFLSAYAEPTEREGEPVLYFSTEDGSAKIATDAQAAGVAERAVRMPAAQHPGRYRVHAYFAQRALRRDEMESAPGPAVLLGKARVEVVIVE